MRSGRWRSEFADGTACVAKNADAEDVSSREHKGERTSRKIRTLASQPSTDFPPTPPAFIFYPSSLVSLYHSRRNSITALHLRRHTTTPRSRRSGPTFITLQRPASRLILPHHRDSPPTSGLIARRVVVPTIEYRTSSVLSRVVSGIRRRAHQAW